MQTFLPYPDFRESVRVLDPLRLGNQIYREALTLITGGWPNHPAARMWKGYWPALGRYAIAGLDELRERGHDYYRHRAIFTQYSDLFQGELPPWFGDNDFHASHRSNLLRKDNRWYGQFGWQEPPNLPYVWPVKRRVISVPLVVPFALCSGQSILTSHN